MASQDILNFILEILAVGGGSAVIAYFAFTYFGKKWLDNKFSKSLEEFKHQQSQDLEHYRFEINSLFNRISKIHEKEFDILPTAWNKLADATGTIFSSMAPLQIYPDFNNKTDLEIEEILKNSNFIESQKVRIRESIDKNETFAEISIWNGFNEGKKAVYDFHNYLVYNKIFLSSELFELFDMIDRKLIKIINDSEVRIRSGEFYDVEIHSSLQSEMYVLQNRIAFQIQKRFHYDEAK